MEPSDSGKGIAMRKETILHFTCEMCRGWWSIAVMDNWVPKELTCPHCSKKSPIKDAGVMGLQHHK